MTGTGRRRLFAVLVTAAAIIATAVMPSDGTSTVITRGWLNGPQSISRTDPPSLHPRAYRFGIELWPTSHVVPAGYRIRLSLTGSDDPGTGVNPHPSTVTIHQDRARPSSLLLPIVDSGPADEWSAS